MEGALSLSNPLAGVRNVCYLNSALQMATAMSKMLDSYQGSTKMDLHRLARIKISSSQAAAPDPVALLAWIKAILPDRLRPRGRQGDAHEALLAIITGIEESSAEGKTATAMIYGGFISDVHCDGCNQRSRTQEPFMQFSIAFPEEGRPLTTIQDYFTQLSAPEDLCGKNQYMCATCGGLRDATKQIYVGKYPRYLIVQVLRFSGARGVKRSDRFAITPYWSGTSKGMPKYRLISVIEHMGSIGGGHYVAYGIRGQDADHSWGEERAWWRLDDDRATPISESHLRSESMERNVYIMLYEYVGKRD